MENEELYPELREYIFQYCGQYFWNKKRLTQLNVPAIAISSDAINIAM
jgi:hypothetical protein